MNSRDPFGRAPLVAASTWFDAFNEAAQRGDAAAAAKLFVEDGHARDLVALTWTVSTVSGRAAIQAMLAKAFATTRPRGLGVAAQRTAPRLVHRAGRDVIEAMADFDTEFGRGAAVARLVPDPEGPGGVRAWILLTSLQSLRGHEETTNACGSQGRDFYNRDFGGENYEDKRRRAARFEDHDPAVLVVGAGQAGLSIAARLGQLGVDTLIVDREARVGDNWRKRYHSLTLHNEVHVNHLPYMPFPTTWPVFIPKDKLANWFEAYVDSLDLKCWTGTELVAGHHDEKAGHWTVRLRRADGSERVMKPRHVVFATGVSAIPEMPPQPGLESFKGTVMHSGSYTEGKAYKGRPALVLGTGNSAHDVAQDLHAAGATVTMIQRSPTHIVSIQEAQRVYALYAEGMPTDDCDLLATAMPYPVLRQGYQLATAISQEADKALLQRLEKRGFRLTDGEDHTGFQMMYLRRGGGYYFNVGASDLVADGQVGLVQYEDIDRFVPEGLRLKDGRVLPAELVVMATGYKNQQEVVRQAMGDAVANRIGVVWGVDSDGELRNMWRPTPQPGLWFIAGSLAQCRIYSKVLALQIKAREAGLLG